MKTRIRIALLASALALSAAACNEGADSAAPTGPTPAGTSSPTTSPEAEPTSSGSPKAQPSPELEDGRHFGYIEAIDPTVPEIVFDLAYFLTGDEANEAAAERGDEVPVPNDYFIINDNPKLRTLSLADDVEILVLEGFSVETIEGDFEDFVAGFETDDFAGDYHGSASQYWLTVKHGLVTRIEEQYLP